MYIECVLEIKQTKKLTSGAHQLISILEFESLIGYIPQTLLPRYLF